jgi:hypothetical protein
VRRTVSLGRGGAVLPFKTWKPGRYRVTLSAVAVNGKRGVARAVVKAKPKPKKKRRRKKH